MMRSFRASAGKGRYAPYPNRCPGLFRALLSVLLGGVIVPGCLFSTRTAQDPAGPEVAWKQPTDPPVVLENIRVTFEAKSADNYNRSLTDDFTFEPDPGDLSQTGPACFDAWSKNKEVQVFTSILKTAGKVTFKWGSHGEPSSPSESPDDRFYRELGYRMVFKPPGVDTVFVGKVDLYMRQINGLWTVYKWVDARVSADTLTLGRVRCAGAINAQP